MKSEEEIIKKIKELKSIKTKDKDLKHIIHIELETLKWIIEKGNILL